MRLLVLGGSGFLSGEVAADALRRGHDVTCLSRGKTGAPPQGAHHLEADRDAGQAAYDGALQDWDCVVDIASDPRRVRQAVAALGARTSHWTYVSSCSVYREQNTPGDDETAALADPLAEDVEFSLDVYAEAKVACENACRQTLGERLHVCRAGLIAGGGDSSDRFGYWPARFARDADDTVLVPRCSDVATQTIDVRDLATWIVAAAEKGVVGNLNAMGETILMPEVLQQARAVSQHHGEPVEVDSDWLLAHEVLPWSGPESLPLWIPPGLDHDGFARRSGDAAVAAGLSRRPLRETLEAALGHERVLGLTRERKAGLSPAREATLLQEWAARPRV